MTVGDSDLRIRPGRIRSTRAPKPKSFINQVLRAAKKAGHTSGQAAGGKRSAAYGRSTFGRGRLAFSRSRLFSPTRRVVRSKSRVPSSPSSARIEADSPDWTMFDRCAARLKCPSSAAATKCSSWRISTAIDLC